MYIDRSYLGNQSYCNEIFVIKKIMMEDSALSFPRFFQVAHQLELGPTERLLFSNAYSALYVMSSDSEPATLNITQVHETRKQKYNIDTSWLYSIANLFTSLPLPPLIRLHNLSLHFYSLYSQKERVGKRWSAKCWASMSNQSRKF